MLSRAGLILLSVCAVIVAIVLAAAAYSFGRAGCHREVAALQAEIRDRDAEQLKLQAAQRIKDDSYVRQLAIAADQAVQNAAELDRLRAAAHPGRVRICAEDRAGRNTLPVPAAAGAAAPAGGVVPQAPGRDITADAYAIVDDADRVVEACRAALARWPRS